MDNFKRFWNADEEEAQDENVLTQVIIEHKLVQE